MDGKRGVDMQVRKGSTSQNTQQIFSAGGALDPCTPSHLEPNLCARNRVFPNEKLNETGNFPALARGGPWVLYTVNIKEFVQNLDAARIHHAKLPGICGLSAGQLSGICGLRVFRVLKNRVLEPCFVPSKTVCFVIYFCIHFW